MKWERLWAASGVIAVALFGCGLLFGDVLASDAYPTLDASFQDTRRYFLDSQSEVRALSFFHTLAAVALLCFAAYLGTVAAGRLAGLTLAAGATAAAFLLLSALCFRTLSEPAVARDAALSHALLLLSYLAGGPAISVPLAPLIGVTTLAARRRELLPRWLVWLGVVATALALASASMLLGPARNTAALFSLLLVAAGLAFLWLVATSVALARR